MSKGFSKTEIPHLRRQLMCREFKSIEITCREGHNTRYKDRKTESETDRQIDKERDRVKDRETTVILNGILSFIPETFYESINRIGLPLYCLPATTSPIPPLSPSMLTWLISFFLPLIELPRTVRSLQYEFPFCGRNESNPKLTVQKDGNICCHILILQNSYSTHISGICLFSALLLDSCIMKSFSQKNVYKFA